MERSLASGTFTDSFESFKWVGNRIIALGRLVGVNERSYLLGDVCVRIEILLVLGLCDSRTESVSMLLSRSLSDQSNRKSVLHN